VLAERVALFGGPLEGDALVRYIYLDEAGISPKEPVSVVAGIIVHADKQWRLAEQRVTEVFDAVPDHFRSDFIFHATSIWSDEKFRDRWSMEDRLALLKAMMALPRQLEIPICLGIVRRNAPSVNLPTQLTQAQYQHIVAFYLCVSRADKYIRDYGEANEVATVVAEDTDIRRLLRATIRNIKPITMLAEYLKPTQAELASGVVKQDEVYMISRVIDSVHFVAKEDGPLLQLADACAFGFRRYFSGQSHGDEFVRSIIAGSLIAEDWAGPASASTFYKRS
jgi:hypothetical protein